MSSESPESGLDELMRLSRQTAKMGREVDEKEKQKAEYNQKVHGVVTGLREISFSVALEQLKLIATSEIIEEISSMMNKPGTEDLRKLISTITHDLETQVSRASASNPEMESIDRLVKTLAIITGLFFSLK
ncbi:hypothetical protein ACFLVZ_02735 [Chloroflexota bacterium]